MLVFKKKKSFHPTPHRKRFHLKEVNDLHARTEKFGDSAVTFDTQMFGTFPSTPEPERAPSNKQQMTAHTRPADEYL